jgi:hypothetical protein
VWGCNHQLTRGCCLCGAPPSLAHQTGFPRIGAKREIKVALEKYWAGKLSQAELIEVSNATQAQVRCVVCVVVWLHTPLLRHRVELMAPLWVVPRWR